METIFLLKYQVKRKHSQTYDFKIEIKKKRLRLDSPSLSLKSTAIFKIYLYKQGLKQRQTPMIIMGCLKLLK